MRYVAAAIVASHLGKHAERHADWGPGDSQVESTDRPRAARRLARGVLLAASALWKTTHSSA